MWLTLALRHWYWIVIGCLTFALALSTLHGKAMKAERDAKIAEIESMRNAAQAYKDQSEQNRRVINDSIPIMVEQAKAQAWKNWQLRFGTGNAACGIRSDGLLPAPHGTGETNRSDGADATGGIELAIEACARDAGRLDAWIAWAKLNQLPVE